MTNGKPVLIVGGGPAGVAAAIALRQLGIECIVIEQESAPAQKPGEALPPNARAVLQKLGIAHLLHDERHGPVTGNSVIWGAGEPAGRYFLAEPNGDGWRLDRQHFEKQLREEAIRKGVTWMSGWMCDGLYRDGSLLGLELHNDGTNIGIEASFVIDASGRTAVIARHEGVKRQRLDELTGCYARVSQLPPQLAGTTFIEAVEDGWWYAAPLKNGKLVVNFMTDPPTIKGYGPAPPQVLVSQLQRTVHLKKYIHIHDAAQFEDAGARPASTSCLDRLTGDRWLACGDAACTYDPISSYGITAALGGAIYAANAIRDHLAGHQMALPSYVHVQQAAFNNCVAMLQHQYRLEQRWKDSPFWAARHQ